jgi:hypothetical protein
MNINSQSDRDNSKDSEFMEPRWKKYERIVEQIHKTLSPKAKITYDDRIDGHDSKKTRQIDISIRQRVGPYPILVIIQCRDYKRKLDVNAVGEFAAVVKDVHASMGVMISNSGFTDGALNLAKEYNIGLYSVVDAENEDWGVTVKLPAVCDFRKPTIEGLFKTTTHTNFTVPTDPNRIDFVKEDGSIINLRHLFLQDWNAGKVDINVGEHVHRSTEKNLHIITEGGTRIPVVVTFNVTVKSRLFFGYIGIEKSQGIVNASTGSYTTKELTTVPLSWSDVETKWRKIASIGEAPQSPAMIVVAQDTFPLD